MPFLLEHIRWIACSYRDRPTRFSQLTNALALGRLLFCILQMSRCQTDTNRRSGVGTSTRQDSCLLVTNNSVRLAPVSHNIVA